MILKFIIYLNTLRRFTFVVDTGKTRLPAQVSGLELILPAILDEVRSALTELKIDLLPDALLTDVQHPVIVEWSAVPVRLSADDDQFHTVQVWL